MRQPFHTALTTPKRRCKVRVLLVRKSSEASAEVVKLVDTLASGASWGNPVEVRVFSSAPILKTRTRFSGTGFFIMSPAAGAEMHQGEQYASLSRKLIISMACSRRRLQSTSM
jgi:hypothetical protein